MSFPQTPPAVFAVQAVVQPLGSPRRDVEESPHSTVTFRQQIVTPLRSRNERNPRGESLAAWLSKPVARIVLLVSGLALGLAGMEGANEAVYRAAALWGPGLPPGFFLEDVSFWISAGIVAASVVNSKRDKETTGRALLRQAEKIERLTHQSVEKVHAARMARAALERQTEWARAEILHQRRPLGFVPLLAQSSGISQDTLYKFFKEGHITDSSLQKLSRGLEQLTAGGAAVDETMKTAARAMTPPVLALLKVSNAKSLEVAALREAKSRLHAAGWSTTDFEDPVYGLTETRLKSFSAGRTWLTAGARSRLFEIFQTLAVEPSEMRVVARLRLNFALLTAVWTRTEVYRLLAQDFDLSPEAIRGIAENRFSRGLSFSDARRLLTRTELQLKPVSGEPVDPAIAPGIPRSPGFFDQDPNQRDRLMVARRAQLERAEEIEGMAKQSVGRLEAAVLATARADIRAQRSRRDIAEQRRPPGFLHLMKRPFGMKPRMLDKFFNGEVIDGRSLEGLLRRLRELAMQRAAVSDEMKMAARQTIELLKVALEWSEAESFETAAFREALSRLLAAGWLIKDLEDPAGGLYQTDLIRLLNGQMRLDRSARNRLLEQLQKFALAPSAPRVLAALMLNFAQLTAVLPRPEIYRRLADESGWTAARIRRFAESDFSTNVSFSNRRRLLAATEHLLKPPPKLVDLNKAKVPAVVVMIAAGLALELLLMGLMRGQGQGAGVFGWAMITPPVIIQKVIGLNKNPSTAPLFLQARPPLLSAA